MFDPYRMIVVNLTLFLLICVGAVVYRYIYPKKPINLFALLIIISLLPVISIFRKGVYESGDFTTHVYRLVDFYRNLQHGQLMPSWAAMLNSQYGYPLFIFLNPLPYYFMSVFHLLGFTFINSVKLYLAVTYILSGIFMYVFVRTELKKPIAAFTAAVIYLYAPYHLVDLHFRNAVGELLIFTLVPLVFYSMKNVILNKSRSYVIASGILFALLFLAHQAMAIFFLPIVTLYTIVSWLSSNKRTLAGIINPCISILLGFFLSSYTWMPHVIYPQYTYANILTNQLVSFPKLSELLYSPWRMGALFQGPNGELSYVIGYTQFIILFISLIVVIQYLRKRMKSQQGVLYTFWIFCSILLIFMMTPYSAIIWNSFPILNTTQFSTRLMLPLVFSIAIIAGYLTLHIKRKSIIVGIIILSIMTTILNWGNRKVIPEIGDDAMIRGTPMSTYYGEAFCCMGSPKWVDIENPWMKDIPKNPMDIISGQGVIKQVTRTPIKHEYIIHAESDLFIRENTLYFPGWQALLNGKSIELLYEQKSYRGIMHLQIPSGLHHLTIHYEDLPLHRILKISNAVGIIGLSGFLLVQLILKMQKKKKSHHKQTSAHHRSYPGK
jgi:hypothetical protein